MNAFKRVFQDRVINNMIVAIIIAVSTVGFMFFVIQQLLMPILHDGPGWGWSLFATQLLTWVASLLVAVGISTFVKGK